MVAPFARSHKRLVLIEDSPDNLDVLRAMLEDNFEVSAFTSCAEALREISDLRPEILVMDIGLAEVDGVQCLKRIRSIPGLEKIPAIAITAYAFPSDRARFLMAGFHAVVVKPIMDASILQRTIVDAMG